MKNMLKLVALTMGISAPSVTLAENLTHLETAARMNTAENLCDINYNGGGPGVGGVVHHVMMAAAEMKLDINTVARMADARQAEIVAYLNRTSNLDSFCQNARRGKL